MSADFDFHEVDNLASDFATAATKIVADTETKVLTPTAQQVLRAAQAAAPVRTGALRSSIRISSAKGSRTIGSDLRQGFFQEFGTSVMSPQPWLFPAADKGGDDMAKRLEDIADPLP